MCELDIVKSHHFFEQPHHLILAEVNCTSLNWWQDYLDHLWKVPEQIAAMSSADLYHLAAPGVVLFKFSKFLLMMRRTPFSTFQHVAPTKANLQEQ